MIRSFACRETERLFNDQTSRRLELIHPGEILREEFMKPRGLSQNGLARALKVPPRRVNEIVLEKRAISADTALRLARYQKQKEIERDVAPLAALHPAQNGPVNEIVMFS